MLKWSLIFLGVALVAAVEGFDGVADAVASNVQLLYFVLLTVIVVSFIRSTMRHA
ncbi:MAG: DUF1328 domain-containing protein [Anaerolineae bacterium]|nr:DUF1328 domain-containing protein [Anaerolineae bacterium]